MTELAHPPLIRALLGATAAFMWTLALFGVARALGGHPPPGHPWSELLLALLGVTNGVGAFGRLETRSAVWSAVALIAAAVAVGAALVWLAVSLIT